MYNPADIKTEILEILERENISKLSEIFKHTTFGKSVIYRNNLNKDPDILTIIKHNRINRKKDLIKSKAGEIIEIREKALEILRETETIDGEEKRKNGIIYRIDFLCAKLHISTGTFYEYGLNEDPELRIELDINREAVKIDGYYRLLNSKQATGVMAFIKLVGNDEERKRISTSYKDIKGKQDIEIALAEERKRVAEDFKERQIEKEQNPEITLADEILELMSNEYIEEENNIVEAEIISSSKG